MSRSVPRSDCLSGGMGGEFCNIGFYITGSCMSIKRKFTNFFHPQRALVFGPLPNCINCFARTFIIWAFFFKIPKNFFGFIRCFKSKKFMVIRITP